jgi:hypothetical protein
VSVMYDIVNRVLARMFAGGLTTVNGMVLMAGNGGGNGGGRRQGAGRMYGVWFLPLFDLYGTADRPSVPRHGGEAPVSGMGGTLRAVIWL